MTEQMYEEHAYYLAKWAIVAIGAGIALCSGTLSPDLWGFFVGGLGVP